MGRKRKYANDSQKTKAYRFNKAGIEFEIVDGIVHEKTKTEFSEMHQTDAGQLPRKQLSTSDREKVFNYFDKCSRKRFGLKKEREEILKIFLQE